MTIDSVWRDGAGRAALGADSDKVGACEVRAADDVALAERTNRVDGAGRKRRAASRTRGDSSCPPGRPRLGCLAACSLAAAFLAVCAVDLALFATPAQAQTAGVTVSKSALTVTEEDATGDTYTVTLNSRPTASVTVTVGGYTGSDVTPNPASLTWAPDVWNLMLTVTVTAEGDTNTVDETVSLTHSATSTDTDYSGITIASVTVTVDDNDNPNTPPEGTPTISGTAQVGEVLTADPSGIIDADGLTTATFTYQWLRVDADGVSNETNIGTNAATYTLAAADAGKKIKVKVSFTDDGGTGETLTSDAYPSSGTITAGTLPALSFASANITVNEDAGTVTLTVELDPASTGTVTVDYATSDQTAQAGVDYTATSGTLTFAASETSKTITVPILNDTDYDPSQRFRVTLSNASGATLPTSLWANVNITNDDAVPTASIANVTVGEGAGTLTLTLALDRLSNSDISYSAVTAGVGGTATVADDYVSFLQGGSKDFTVPAGAMSATFDITIVDDSVDEPDETIVIVWTKFPSHDATPASTTVTGTITDNDTGNNLATGTPTISGTAAVGETLMAAIGNIADTDGLPTTFPDDYTFQWLRRDGGTDSPITGATASTYTPVAADVGKKVKVTVSFTDDGGTGEDRTSNAYPSSGRIVTDFSGRPSVPSAPSIGATEGSNTSLDVGWLEPANAGPNVNYDLRYQRNEGAWTNGPQDVTAKFANITGLSAGTYRVQVRASNNNGDSNWSPSGTGRTDSGEAPGAPTNLNATANGQNRIELNWTAPSSEGGTIPSNPGEPDNEMENDRIRSYKIEVRSAASNWLVLDRTIGSTDTVYSHRDVPAGVIRCYRVSATNTAGTGPPSNEAVATTDGAEGTCDRPPTPDPQMQQSQTPLAASFVSVPATHDGETPFWLELSFDAPLAQGSKTPLRELLDVTGGSETKFRRKNGQLDHWQIRIAPSSQNAVTVMLSPSAPCGDSGAVCTDDGRTFTTGLGTQIQITAPATTTTTTDVPGLTIRIRDATGDEDDGWLDFKVRLSRKSTDLVCYDFETISGGNATEGTDYLKIPKATYWMQIGKRVDTPFVRLIDDSVNDNGETVKVKISNAHVCGDPSQTVSITRAEATGTIRNSDPLPRALMARFGRTAAVHVVEHVEERLAAPREVGVEAQVAGRQLRPGMARELALDVLRQLGSSAGMHAPGAGSPGARSGSPMGAAAGSIGLGAGMGGPAGGGMGVAADPMNGMAGPDGGLFDRGLSSMGLGGEHLLTNSSFALTRETRQGGILSFWSRGARSSFAGREEALSLGGDVRTTMVGADYAKGPLVTGLSLSNSRGLGEYAGVSGGQVASAVTGLYPWLGYTLSDRVSVWGVTGYGKGALTLTPGEGAALTSGLSMAMAAAGTRGALVAGGASGFELAFKADALWVGTSIDGVEGPGGNVAATAAAVTRFRTGLEGARGYALAGRLSLRPSVEVGLRHDGGDAETGAGLDVGGGLVVSDASTGLTVDLRVRMLVMHQADGFSERGMALSLSYNPTPSTPLGLTARVAPSWGGEATSGAEAMWGRETMAGMANGGLASGNRLEGEVGYGLPVGSRFVGTPRVGVSTSEYGRDYRIGYGLGVLDRERLNLELGVDAHRRESPMLDGTDNGFLGRATLRW